MKINALIVGFAGFLVACASQTAETNIANDELANSKSFHRARLEVDAQFPPSPLPDNNLRPTRVLEVENDASFRFENGTHAKMEGVKCEPNGVARLRELLIGARSTVVFVPNATSSPGPIPGEVFLAEGSPGGPTELANSFTRVAESALLSGWCTPDLQGAPRLTDRYRALADLAKKRPPRS
jgi:hypothetical protein